MSPICTDLFQFLTCVVTRALLSVFQWWWGGSEHLRVVAFLFKLSSFSPYCPSRIELKFTCITVILSQGHEALNVFKVRGAP